MTMHKTVLQVELISEAISVPRPVEFVENAGEELEELAFDLLGNDLD